MTQLVNYVKWMGGKLAGTDALTAARDKFKTDASGDANGQVVIAAEQQLDTDNLKLINCLDKNNSAALTALTAFRTDEVNGDSAQAATDLSRFEGMLTKEQAKLFGNVQTDNKNITVDLKACSSTIQADYKDQMKQRKIALQQDGI